MTPLVVTHALNSFTSLWSRSLALAFRGTFLARAWLLTSLQCQQSHPKVELGRVGTVQERCGHFGHKGGTLRATGPRGQHKPLVVLVVVLVVLLELRVAASALKYEMLWSLFSNWTSHAQELLAFDPTSLFY